MLRHETSEGVALATDLAEAVKEDRTGDPRDEALVALILSGLWDEAHKLYALACEEVEDRFLGEKRFAG